MIIALSGCTSFLTQEKSYTSISMQEALEIMEKGDDYILVDVRTIEEYQSGHIPDAINIPLDSIDDLTFEQLKDKTQTILIYCRSGNRSKQAAEKLSKLGYDQIYEIGGINDWKGEIVTEEPFVYERAEIDCSLIIEAGDKQMYVYLGNSETCKALIEKLKEEKEIEVSLKDYGNFEKTGKLPWQLPRDDKQIKAQTGDVFLYEGDQISVFYDENTWDYTRIGHLVGMTKEEILDVLGNGDITVKLWLDFWDY